MRVHLRRRLRVIGVRRPELGCGGGVVEARYTGGWRLAARLAAAHWSTRDILGNSSPKKARNVCSMSPDDHSAAAAAEPRGERAVARICLGVPGDSPPRQPGTRHSPSRAPRLEYNSRNAAVPQTTLQNAVPQTHCHRSLTRTPPSRPRHEPGAGASDATAVAPLCPSPTGARPRHRGRPTAYVRGANRSTRSFTGHPHLGLSDPCATPYSPGGTLIASSRCWRRPASYFTLFCFHNWGSPPRYRSGGGLRLDCGGVNNMRARRAHRVSIIREDEDYRRRRLFPSGNA